ncbi:MAG: glycosyltransferase family 4 protein [Spirosomataceae bacterium]
MKRVLFFTPTGGRTGSEMMLKYLISQVSDAVVPAVFTRGKGEIFQEESYSTFKKNKRGVFIESIFNGVYFKIKGELPEIEFVKSIQKQFQADIWYLNTIQMYAFAPVAQKLGIPYIVHVHELIGMYEEVPEHSFENLFRYADKIICCSQMVEERIQSMGYKNTSLIHANIDVSHIQINEKPTLIREKLRIPSNAFVWVMSGSTNLRKGFDLVPDLLANLPDHHYLLWLGASLPTGLRTYVLNRVKQENRHFIMAGELNENYYDYLNAADGFVLLSREDPFPLVMLEAAYLQKPIVSFASGGAKEFVLPEMGRVIDTFNPAHLAQEMIRVEQKAIPFSPQIAKERAAYFDVSARKKEWKSIFSDESFEA